MGSLVGLFFGSTDPNEVNKKLVGRSFNVKTGTMQSTKKIYDVKDQTRSDSPITRPETPKIMSEELKPTENVEEVDKTNEESTRKTEETSETPDSSSEKVQ